MKELIVLQIKNIFFQNIFDAHSKRELTKIDWCAENEHVFLIDVLEGCPPGDPGGPAALTGVSEVSRLLRAQPQV